MILGEPISKLIIIIIGFIYFTLPTSVEDIGMSTPVSSLLKLIIIYPNGVRWEGLNLYSPH